MTTSGGGPRFELLTEAELEALIESSDANSTKKSIKFGFSKLESFAKLKNFELTDISITKEKTSNLDSLLTSFYASLRKEDGSLYMKKSLQYIRYGIQRHYLDNCNIDICSNALFPKSVRMYKAVLIKLKREGLGSTKHKEAISHADMEKIQTSAQLDCLIPAGLQNKVFVDILTYFCNRGRENVRLFKASDFSVCVDEGGMRYVQKRDHLTKNHRENDDERTGGFMYEISNSDRCPLKTFNKYVSKLNPACPWFWQKPKPTEPKNDGDPWFYNSPVGINTLSNKMKIISTGANCSRIYTNHCLRATCVTTLDQSGFESRDIMSVSGHRSESSIKIYTKTSRERKKEMSDKIGQHLYNRQSDSHDSSLAGPSASSTAVVVPVDLHVSSEQHTIIDGVLVGDQQHEQTATSPSNDTRLPLAAMQPARSPMALSLSSQSNTTHTSSHSFNMSNCVVHIHNH